MTSEDYRPEVLKKLREGLGLSTVDLAKLLKTTDRTIQRAEAGSLTWKLLMRYVKVFAVERDQILKPVKIQRQVAQPLKELRRRAREVMEQIAAEE